MTIAVTYGNGEIFQHFGRTEYFKLYEVEDNAIASIETVDSQGSGHGALAGVLAANNVDLLICGGIGGGAMNALEDYGITVIAGVSGDPDEAVEAYLKGELTSTGVNCDHHENGEEEHCCGHHGEEEGCHCGGGCGHHRQSDIEGRNVGKKVKAHYRGTFNDGTQFDSSYDRGEPLEFVCGAGMMIKGFDKAVADMEVGQEVDVHLMPEEAYGPSDPNAIFTIEMEQLPGCEELKVGDQVYLSNGMGQPFPVKVIGKDLVNITFDANHEMAGKELNFHIELVWVE